MLKVTNISKSYKTDFWKPKITALKDLSFEINRGETCGFLGLNGAGKTTTFKILTNVIFPSSGSATLDNLPITSTLSKKKIGYMPENPYFYDYLTAYEFLDFCCKLFDIEPKKRAPKINELLETVGLKEKIRAPLRSFSKGMLQRIGIAQTMINNPELILLDEPMSGLDPIGRKEVRDIILRLKQEKKTIFFSSHIISDMELLVDRIIMINKGKKIDAISKDDLLKNRIRSLEIVFQINDPEALRGEINFQFKLEKTNEGKFLALLYNQEELDYFAQKIYSQKGKIYTIQQNNETLEDFFLKKVKENVQ